MAEYTTSGSTTALATRYDYLPGEFAPLQIETDNSKYSVHTDHLATPKLLTDSSGQVVWRSVRAAFGETAVNDDVDGNGVAVGLNIRFPGQYFDGESGLHYNYFRDYDPGVGRYVQSDPLGLYDGPNSYGYVQGNPINSIDLFGLSTEKTWCARWLEFCTNPGNSAARKKALKEARKKNKQRSKNDRKRKNNNDNGGCTPTQKAKLQAAKDRACNIPRSCNAAQSCEALETNYLNNMACASARDVVMNTCYNGGDSSHVAESRKAQDAANRCWDILKDKPDCGYCL